LCSSLLAAISYAAESGKVSLAAIGSPILFRGDATTAYRDPAVIYHDGWFRLFFTLVKIEPDKRPFSYNRVEQEPGLGKWSEPVIFTPRDQNLNFGSPATSSATATGGAVSPNLPASERREVWQRLRAHLDHAQHRPGNVGPPELLRVKGPDVPVAHMGRMIDAYLLEDKDELGKWWCFYKQAGMSMSWSRDLQTWTYAGRTSAGENACVIIDGDDYVLFHSPANGLG